MSEQAEVQRSLALIQQYRAAYPEVAGPRRRFFYENDKGQFEPLDSTTETAELLWSSGDYVTEGETFDSIDVPEDLRGEPTLVRDVMYGPWRRA